MTELAQSEAPAREADGKKPDDPSAEFALAHAVHRAICWAVAPIWVPLAALTMRFYFGVRLGDVREARREFRRLRAERDTPLLVCANHLTLIDSFLIAWALSNPFRYLVDFDAMPWNTPEETNFANTRRNRLLAYLGKCIPIRRGGSREDVARVLGRVSHLLKRGELALVFPEGGRSRTGRVEAGSAAWGVGRIVAATPGCRVLCVYMRGEKQETWSDYPGPGDRLQLKVTSFEPKSDRRGVRRTRDIAQQIVGQLMRLEEEFFHGRQ